MVPLTLRTPAGAARLDAPAWKIESTWDEVPAKP
jgi:hypothetical protein